MVKRYDKFRGVDFSTDPAMIDSSRSPVCQNLISDAGGYPEKRLGWATVKTYPDRVNGVFRLVDGNGGEHHVVHHGKTLTLEQTVDGAVKWDGVPTVLSTTMNDDRSTAFHFENKLYILDGENYLVYDGATLANVTDVAFVPTTTINAPPSGGGVTFEATNLLTPWRKNSFAGNGTDKDFYVDGAIDSGTTVTATVNGTATTAFTVDHAAGKITFTSAPPDGEGVDNVVITFSNTVSGDADKITGCRFAMWYGAGAYSRVFVSGNPSFRNHDWHSGLYDPTYFPSNGYTIFGTSDSAVMGYLRQYNSMLVIKEDNNQDATMFVRSAEIDDNGQVVFPVKQGVAGVGAVSPHTFASLRDNPLFLSRQGVFTPTLDYGGAGQERSMQSRSYFVDARLTKEDNMDAAVAVVWDGFYILCVNGHCYVADSRQKTSKSATESTSYEWYYWTNIDARVLAVVDDMLYFGRDDGALCVFRSDEITGLKYNDDDAPVDAVWATKQDDDGDFMLLKTMERLGSGIMIKPYSRSSVEVAVNTENGERLVLASKTTDIFDFNNLDFTRFTFSTNDAPDVLPFGLYVRKYRTLQIIARNNELNEGFGVYGFIKRYKPVKFVK
jgi:hypothetical protein